MLPTSNRDNQKLVEYYQSLADIIAIFWQFHKERIQTGNLEFAYTRNNKGGLEPFDPRKEIEYVHKFRQNPLNIDITEEFLKGKYLKEDGALLTMEKEKISSSYS